jgi:hypothetical protein
MTPRAARTRLREPGLTGAWWRCPMHGLTEEPVVLGPGVYCPDGDCVAVVRLVHSAMDDPVASEWNKIEERKTAPWREGDE